MNEETSTSTQTGSLFSEEQAFDRGWMRLLIFLVAAGTWFVFLEQVVGGQSAAGSATDTFGAWGLLIIVGILVPWLLLSLKLHTNLKADHLEIRFSPLMSRDIPLRDIKRAYARSYRPLIEYGGWGIRCGRRGRVAYNVSGHHGVELELVDGKSILIGSQRAEALAAAIGQAMGR